MARYKQIDTGPRFIAVDLARQLVPGPFEYALDYPIDHEIDLSGFDGRYRNDATGAAACPPNLLLKVCFFRGRASPHDESPAHSREGRPWRHASSGKSSTKSKMARLPARHSSPGKPRKNGFVYNFNVEQPASRGFMHEVRLTVGLGLGHQHKRR